MLLPKQIWKDIEGYEGLYQVSNTGKVRSLNYLHTGKTKALKQGTDKDGYKKVVLKSKGYFIHRLVAQAFIPNPLNLPQVNHKDENPGNNAVWNLEWCTQEYNNNYGTHNEKISNARKGKNNPMYGSRKGKHQTNNTLYINTQHQTQLKEQLDKIHQIYNDCHHK